MVKGDIRNECSKLLQRVQKTEELIALVDTVTNRQIRVTSRNEAVRVILDYTQSPIELLRRKKMKRDYLFDYLASCNVVVAPNAEKKSLIQTILKLWHVEAVQDLDLLEFEEENSLEADNREGHVHNTHQMGLVAPPAAGAGHVEVTAHTSTTYSVPPQNETNSDIAKSSTQTEAQQFAEQFTQWFYQIWNSCNQENIEFGPQHFFENCTLSLFLRTFEMSEEKLEGNDAVCQRFAQFVKLDGLSFNPNPQAVQGLVDVYGRYVVNVCGTLHQQQNAVGLFEQQFGMIRDPHMQNNWRVKFVKLKMNATSDNSRTIEDRAPQALTQGSSLVPCGY